MQNPSDYITGLKLYELHGDSAFFKTLFRNGGASAYNQKKLIEKLTELCSSDVQDEPVKEVIPEVVKPVDKDKKAVEDQAEYIRLLKQRDDTYRTIERHMSILDFSKSKNVRFESCKLIDSLHRKVSEIWEKLDYYTEFGKMPDPIPEKVIKTDEMQRLYVQINKAKSRLKKPDCRDRRKTEELLKTKQERLAELKANG